MPTVPQADRSALRGREGHEDSVAAAGARGARSPVPLPASATPLQGRLRRLAPTLIWLRQPLSLLLGLHLLATLHGFTRRVRLTGAKADERIVLLEILASETLPGAGAARASRYVRAPPFSNRSCRPSKRSSIP